MDSQDSRDAKADSNGQPIRREDGYYEVRDRVYKNLVFLYDPIRDIIQVMVHRFDRGAGRRIKFLEVVDLREYRRLEQERQTDTKPTAGKPSTGANHGGS